MISDDAIQGELDADNPLIAEVGERSMTLFGEPTSETERRERP